MIFIKAQQTVRRRSLSFEVIVEGEKWSFLSIVCLIVFKRFRMAATRDSAEPDTVNGARTLQQYEYTRTSSKLPFKHTSQMHYAPRTSSRAASRMHLRNGGDCLGQASHFRQLHCLLGKRRILSARHRERLSSGRLACWSVWWLRPPSIPVLTILFIVFFGNPLNSWFDLFV